MSFKATASGFVTSDGNGNFSSTFTLTSGVIKSFNGKFSSAIPAFSAALSQVQYNKDSDLSGNYSVDANATAGPSTINLPLVNHAGNVLITGKLNPYLDEAYTVDGSGQWFSS